MVKRRLPKLSAKALKTKPLKLPFYKFIPNLITLTALCAGLSALHFCLKGKWETGLMLVFLSMLLDGIDGRVARLLNSATKFGAELDSLADFCNFGIVPSLVIYLHCLQGLGRLGWAVILMYSICMVLRLARFNTLLDLSSNTSKYFMGVPAPLGALLSLLPIIIELYEPEWIIGPIPYAIWLVIISVLLISQIPTFSFKQGHVPKAWILPIFVCAGLVMAALIVSPWLTLAILATLYLLSIPVSYGWTKAPSSEKPDED